MKANKKGFTLVEIMIVVSIIGLLSAIAMPELIKAREKAQQNICISNMRLISHAVEQAAFTRRWPSSHVFSEADILILQSYAKNGGKGVVCPADGEYEILSVTSSPTCTIPSHVFDQDEGGGGGNGDPMAAAGG